MNEEKFSLNNLVFFPVA